MINLKKEKQLDDAKDRRVEEANSIATTGHPEGCICFMTLPGLKQNCAWCEAKQEYLESGDIGC